MTKRPMARDTRRALYDLQVSDARWQAILATARDAIVAIDARGRITLFNPAAEQVFGYRAEEALGQNVSLLMPAPYRDEHDEYLRRYERTGEARAIGRIRSVHGRRKNGEVFPIELSVSESQLGDEVLYTAILRDVTGRLATEEALRAQRDFAERLIETAPLIVLVLDPAGNIVRYNAQMEQVCGRPLADVAGTDWSTTFVPERERARVRALCAAALRGELVGSHVHPISTAGGDERQVEWNFKSLPDGSGGPLGLLCIGEDVTERLAAQLELLELQRST